MCTTIMASPALGVAIQVLLNTWITTLPAAARDDGETLHYFILEISRYTIFTNFQLVQSSAISLLLMYKCTLRTSNFDVLLLKTF